MQSAGAAPHAAASISGTQWTRQIHRWVSIAFTVGVIVNIAAMSKGPPPFWVGLLALLPLVILLFSGLYLFALPYAAKWRRARRAA